jgi:polysaccharide biosynthesis/export protein
MKKVGSHGLNFTLRHARSRSADRFHFDAFEPEVSMRKRLWVVVAVLVSAVMLAQTTTLSPASGQDKNTPTFSERYARYQLRPGDIFDLFFEFTPEFNQTLTVQPDGFVALRDAGEINVNGLTVPEVTERIRTAYDRVLFNPRISVLLKDFEKPYFIADGQLNHPGKYELRGDTTVAQAIAVAGGFTNAAKHSQVVLFRRVNDNWVEARLLNVKQMENGRNLSEDVHLKPGDMILVPKNRMSKIQQFLPSYGISMIPKTF